MKSATLSRTGALSLSFAALACPAVVAAQDTTPDVSEEAESDGIDVIVVTAQKRSEDVQDVPISITAVSGETLAQKGISDFEDLAFYVPNFKFDSSTQLINARIGVRGVSSSGNSGFESSVGVFVDEAYVPRPGATLGSLFDVEAVEVLRGPQGTLFGRNTPMGALSIRTSKPKFDMGGSVRLFGDTITGYGAGGHLTGPISDSVAFRLAGEYRYTPDWINNSFSGEEVLGRDSLGLRGSLLWELSDAITVTLVGDYSRIDYTGVVVDFIPEAMTSTFSNRFTAVTGNTLDFSDPFDKTIRQVHDDDGRNEQFGINLRADIETGFGTLTSITAYRDWKDTQLDEEVVRLPAEILFRDRITKTDNFSQEVRLASDPGDFVTWLAGLYYYRENYTTDSVFNLGDSYCNQVLPAINQAALRAPCNAAPAGAVIDAHRQKLDSMAMFGNVTFNISDQFRVTGGLRYTIDDKEGSFERRRPNIAAIVVAPNNEIGLDDNQRVTDKKLTYSLTAQYDITDAIMAYASYSTGFKSGGINSESQPLTDPRVFGPETVKNYEVGIKSALFDRKLIANLTAFRTDLDDFQERTFTGTGFIVGNAGSLRQQGVELEVNARPISWARLDAGIAYLDSAFTDFDNAPGLPGGPPQDLTGRPRQDSPKWSVSLGSQFDGELTSSLGWNFRTEYQYTSAQFLSSDLNPQSVQPGFSLVNLRAGIEDFDNGWRLSVFAKNVLDQGYCTRIFNQVLGGLFRGVDATNNTSVQRCVAGSPRTLGAELSYRF